MIRVKDINFQLALKRAQDEASSDLEYDIIEAERIKLYNRQHWFLVAKDHSIGKWVSFDDLMPNGTWHVIAITPDLVSTPEDIAVLEDLWGWEEPKYSNYIGEGAKFSAYPRHDYHQQMNNALVKYLYEEKYSEG